MLDQLDFERMESNKAAKDKKATGVEEAQAKAQAEADSAAHADGDGVNGAGQASSHAQAPA